MKGGDILDELKNIQNEIAYTSDDSYLFNFKNKEKDLDKLLYKLSKFEKKCNYDKKIKKQKKELKLIKKETIKHKNLLNNAKTSEEIDTETPTIKKPYKNTKNKIVESEYEERVENKGLNGNEEINEKEDIGEDENIEDSEDIDEEIDEDIDEDEDIEEGEENTNTGKQLTNLLYNKKNKVKKKIKKKNNKKEKKSKKKKNKDKKTNLLENSIKLAGGSTDYNCNKLTKNNIKLSDNIFAIGLSFIPVVGEFNRYVIPKSYKNYMSVYKNPYFVKDMVLFLLGHILSVWEIFGIIFFIIKYIEHKTILPSTIYIICSVIILRIVFSILIYNNLVNKKKYINNISNITKIREYLQCLNKFLINPTNKLKTEQINKIKKQLYFMSNYYKKSIIKNEGIVSNFMFVIIMFILLILPKILFIIMLFIKELSVMDSFILSTLILFLLLPYFRIVLSYIDPEEKYTNIWIIAHIMEKFIVIGLVYVIVLSILKNKEIDYDNIMDIFRSYLNNIVNNDISNNEPENKVLNNFNKLFNK